MATSAMVMCVGNERLLDRFLVRFVTNVFGTKIALLKRVGLEICCFLGLSKSTVIVNVDIPQ